MVSTPESPIPSHPNCKRPYCKEICQTANHIKMVTTGDSPDDTVDPTVRKQLWECQHLKDNNSPHHEPLETLKANIETSPTTTSLQLLMSMGMSEEEALKQLAEDDAEEAASE